jgi:hypothetical protein
LENYSQISTFKKMQVQVQMKKTGQNDESSLEMMNGWDGPKGSPLTAPICLSKS